MRINYLALSRFLLVAYYCLITLTFSCFSIIEIHNLLTISLELLSNTGNYSYFDVLPVIILCCVNFFASIVLRAQMCISKRKLNKCSLCITLLIKTLSLLIMTELAVVIQISFSSDGNKQSVATLMRRTLLVFLIFDGSISFSFWELIKKKKISPRLPSDDRPIFSVDLKSRRRMYFPVLLDNVVYIDVSEASRIL